MTRTMTTASNGKGRLKLTLNDHKRVSRGMAEMLLNAMTMRSDWIKSLQKDRRDVDEECRYPDDISPEEYRTLFDRLGPAKRVVSIEPKESWLIKPEITDTDEAEESEFEAAWSKLNKRHKVLSVLQRVDILSGIGHYG